jgi:hypothetical protein
MSTRIRDDSGCLGCLLLIASTMVTAVIVVACYKLIQYLLTL